MKELGIKAVHRLSVSICIVHIILGTFHIFMDDLFSNKLPEVLEVVPLQADITLALQ